MKEKINELQKLAEPLIKYLEENHDHQCKLVITAEDVILIREEMLASYDKKASLSEKFVPADSSGIKKVGIGCEKTIG